MEMKSEKLKKLKENTNKIDIHFMNHFQWLNMLKLMLKLKKKKIYYISSQ